MQQKHFRSSKVPSEAFQHSQLQATVTTSSMQLPHQGKRQLALCDRVLVACNWDYTALPDRRVLLLKIRLSVWTLLYGLGAGDVDCSKMSMRLVKQQLAALSSKASANSTSVEKDKASKAQLKKKGRKQKKESAKIVKKKKQSTVGLSGAEIKKHNLEYLKTSQPADKSVDLMNKVGIPSM